jgi:hypothetical protein
MTPMAETIVAILVAAKVTPAAKDRRLASREAPSNGAGDVAAVRTAQIGMNSATTGETPRGR